MNLPRFSVQRPVFTSMMILIIVVMGVFSFLRIQIDMLPTIELPTLTIETRYEGASPDVMEEQVTQFIEEIVSTVPGVEELRSNSSEGNSRVRVTFAWGTDINAAALEVQATLEDEINELPEDIERPRVSKWDINSSPIVLLGISGDLDPVELTEIAENQIRYRFSRIPGVAQVDLFGGYNREVRIELDLDRVKSLGIPLNEVLDAIRNANLDLPTGRIEEGNYEVTLRAPAQFRSIEQISNTVVETEGGASVRIGDIAEVRDTHERITRAVRVNGDLGLRVGIRKQANANTVEVSKLILREIEEVNRDLPQVEVVAIINQGNLIERSIANVAQSVLYGGGLAVLVLLFFLRNVRSTMVISLSIPISIIATFSLIYLGGFTINLMTLGGLALGVGMMVDSSIVVLENIFRRRDREGEHPMEAAHAGAQEVAGAILASTITTLVIFLPLIFVQGVSGLLFGELAYVVAFALMCSLFVSLSLVPMMSSRILRPKGHGERVRSPRMQRLKERADAAFDGLDAGYASLLTHALRQRWRVVLISLSTLILSAAIWPFIGSELLPPSDEGEVRVNGEMEVGTRLELTNRQSRIIEEVVVAEVPEARARVVSASDGEIDVRLNLVKATERRRSNVEVADALREKLEGTVPGVEIRTRAPQGQFLLERLLGGGGDGLAVEIRGPDLDTLAALAQRVEETIQGIAGVTDVDRDLEEGMPQQEIRLDRDKIADLGLSVRDVTELLRTAVAGSQAGNFYTEGESYRILVQLKDAEQLTVDEVLDLTLGTPDGGQVALRNVVEAEFGRAPLEINRNEQRRQVQVSANVSGRPLGDVAEEVQAAIDGIPRPSGYELDVAGSFEKQQESFAELRLSMLLALLLVYMVLACQYESLSAPLIVMLSVPMAAVGVLLTLFITNTTLNLQSGIGCIMLVGIVVNNAILLVDQASRLHRDGVAVDAAVTEAGRRRLRPILMTTATTVLGLLPLALGIGEGADAQAPLARAVVGGLLGSTVITLLLIPVAFSLVYNRRKEAA